MQVDRFLLSEVGASRRRARVELYRADECLKNARSVWPAVAVGLYRWSTGYLGLPEGQCFSAFRRANVTFPFHICMRSRKATLPKKIQES